MKSVDFYFDVGSPAAYLAWTQMPRIAQETGATLVRIPFLLGGVFQATGNKSPTEVPAKGRYMQDDLARFAQRYGAPFQHNPHFPINTLMLMRGATGLLMKQEDKFVPYVDAVYRAIWVDSLDMNDPAVVGAALHKAGFDPAALVALASDPEVKERLKSVTMDAVQRGAFGAPTFFVDGAMFWGQDRLDFVTQALNKESA